MERWWKGFHCKGKIYQQDIFSWYIQETLKLFDIIALKSLNTCINQLASPIVFGCLFPSCHTSKKRIL